MMILGGLLKLRLKVFGGFFNARSSERVLKLIIGIAVTIFFLTFGYWFFQYIFSYLKDLGDVGILLMGRVLSLSFFAVLVLLFISNLLTGISTIFNNKETTELFSLPLDYRNIFTIKSIDNTLYSSWAFAVLGLPMIIAYGGIVGYNYLFYAPIILFVFIPFMLIPSAASVFVLMLYFRFAKNINPKKIIILFAALLSIVIYLYLKHTAPENLSLYTYQDWRILNNYLSGMALSSSMIFPSSWVSNCLQSVASGNYKDAFINSFALFSTALFFWEINIILSKYIFAVGWQNSLASGSSAEKQPAYTRFLLAPLKWGHNPLPQNFKNMLYKDSVIFFRDGSQWGQFFILFGLILVYLFNLRFFPADLTDPFWKSVVAFANFAFMGFVLATLSVRFVFPTISLEGKSIWTLKSAPLKPAFVFWEKFAVSFLFFSVLAEILAYISSAMLGLTPLMRNVNYIGVFLISLSLTGLSVGMGAVYPDFEKQNPSKIASGAGGMITAILSLIYVCIMVVLAAYMTHIYTQFITEGERINSAGIIFSFAAAGIISIITFVVPVFVGLRNFRNLEV